jgi:hypothetical protein
VVFTQGCQDHARARKEGHEDALYQAALAAWQVTVQPLNGLRTQYRAACAEARLHGVPDEAIGDVDVVHQARVALDAAQANHDRLLAACRAAKPREGVFRLSRAARLTARGALAVAAILSTFLSVSAYFVVTTFTFYRFAWADVFRSPTVLSVLILGLILLYIPIALFHFAIFRTALIAP